MNPARFASSSAAAALALAAGLAFAQPAPPAPAPKSPAPKAPAPKAPAAKSPAPKTPTTPTGAPIEFGATPYVFESIGLRVRLPVDSVYEATSMGDRTSLIIAPADRAWSISVDTPRTSRPETTEKDAADAALSDARASVGTISADGKLLDTKAKTISRDENLTYAGRPAERFYVLLPDPAGKNGAVKGYTALKASPERFVVLELRTTEPKLAEARAVYEAVLSKLEFVDATDVATSRAVAVQAGTKLFASLSTDRYESVFKDNSERWERLFRPARDGGEEQEIAYRRIRASLGQRGALDPKKRPADYTATERQEGYVVRIDARVLQGGVTIDSESIFFLSKDKADEAWTVRIAARQGQQTSITTQTGARSGTSMNVDTVGSGQANTNATPKIPEEGYLSNVEAFLLPQFLAAAGAPSDYGFYVWQPAAAKVRLRRDAMELDPDNARRWKIITRRTEDDAPETTILTREGKLVRTTLPDGSTWEPTTLSELQKIWRNKKLPMQ
ncbi:MAG: hypothetical protein SFY95_07425 [Planctomycetota bacterium]|nr:hypothetical protein [Planctomycetota bacterium]